MDVIVNIFVSIVTVFSTGYLFFMFLGKKWLEEKFSKRLEAYKHEQAKELEDMKFSINSQFNRITKIHEKEIEILPIAWMKLILVTQKLTILTSPLKQYPNFIGNSPEETNKIVDATAFTEDRKTRIKNSTNKLESYQDAQLYFELSETYDASADFNSFIENNSIFLTTEIKNRFKEVNTIIRKTILDKQFGHEDNNRTMIRSTYNVIEKEVYPIKDEIEKLVQKRLQLDTSI